MLGKPNEGVGVGEPKKGITLDDVGVTKDTLVVTTVTVDSMVVGVGVGVEAKMMLPATAV